MVKNILRSVYYGVLKLITRDGGLNRNINGFVIKLPFRYFKYFSANYEADNFSFFKKVAPPQATCIDVGAHIGLFSIFMHKTKGGKVYSLEPTPLTFQVLQHTIALNHAAAAVKPIEAAAAAKAGTTVFYIDEHAVSNANSLVNFRPVHTSTTSTEVRLTSVDDLVAQEGIRVQFIKIDAEGAELDVLLGAATTLLQQRPFAILAMHPASIAAKGDAGEDIWNAVEGFGYQVVHGRLPMAKNDFLQRKYLFDVYLIPAEKMSTISL